MYTIYSIINIINGKRYIGLTKQSVKQRWSGHLSDSKRKKNYLFNRAIRKYGPDAFKCEILQTFRTIKEANILEVKWIKYFNSNDKTIGYNSTPGGKCYKQSEETKSKIRSARKLQPCPRTGKYHSAESKLKMSLGHIGKKRKPFSNETRSKMAIARRGRAVSEEVKTILRDKNIGKQLSAETKAKISSSNKGKKMSSAAIKNRLISVGPKGSSKFWGVSFDKGRNKWKAQIQINGKNKAIGRFATEIEAAKARDLVVKQLGYDLLLNFE